MIVKLLTYNIRFGGHEREAFIAEVVRGTGADVVVFQEATDPAVIRSIAQATQMPVWDARPRHSLGFMSRIEVSEHAWHRPWRSRHAFLEIVLGDSGFRVFGVHLSAVHAAWTEWRRTVELRALLAEIARHQEGFHALVGDFNTLAPGEVLEVHKLPPRLRPFVWLSGGSIRWQTIKIVLGANYVDTYRNFHPHHAGVTFPTTGPHVRLDYVFVPEAYADRVKSCEVVTSPIAARASDHFPLLAEIELR